MKAEEVETLIYILIYQPFKFPLGPEPEPEFPRRAKGLVDSGPR